MVLTHSGSLSGSSETPQKGSFIEIQLEFVLFELGLVGVTQYGYDQL